MAPPSCSICDLGPMLSVLAVQTSPRQLERHVAPVRFCRTAVSTRSSRVIPLILTRTGHLYSCFRYCWLEVWSLCRRSILLSIPLLLAPAGVTLGVQRIAFFLVMALFLCLHLLWQPYIANKDNWAETLSLTGLVALTGMMASNSFFVEASDPNNDPYSYFSVHICIVIITVCVSTSLLLILLHPFVMTALSIAHSKVPPSVARLLRLQDASQARAISARLTSASESTNTARPSPLRQSERKSPPPLPRQS